MKYAPATSQDVHCVRSQVRILQHKQEAFHRDELRRRTERAAKQAAQAPYNSPVLESWCTSWVWSVLGLTLGTALVSLACFISGMLVATPVYFVFTSVGIAMSQTESELYYSAVSVIAGLALLAVVLVLYVKVVYASLFTHKPLMRSRSLISFANCAFGTVLFGPFWNRGLTKGISGRSVNVSVVTAVATMIVTVSISMAPVARATMSADDFALAQNVIFSKSLAALLLDDENSALEHPLKNAQVFGASFIAPAGWEAIQTFHANQKASFSPQGHAAVGFSLSVFKIDESNGETAEVLLDRYLNSSKIWPNTFRRSNVQEQVQQTVTLGAYSYQMVIGNFDRDSSESIVPRCCTLSCESNGFLYIFAYRDDDTYSNDYYYDFIRAVSSMKFIEPSCLAM